MITKKTNKFELSKFALSIPGIALAFVVLLGLFVALRGGNGSSPIIFSLGSLQFRWYGVIVTLGVLSAALIAQYLAERRRDNVDHIWVLLAVVLIAGLVTARLWYVAFTWDNYSDAPFSFGDARRPGIFEVWRGGVAIQGGVLGGVLAALVYCRINKLSFWRFADYGAVGLALAIAIGRWGNFFNNEAYGRETKLFWGIKIPCEAGYRTSGQTPGTVDLRCPPANPNGLSPDALFHPAFLYESLWCYACFLVLFFIAMKPKTFERRFKVRPRNGDLFLLFLVLYSAGRFFIESLRTDSLFFGGDANGIRVAQVVSILAILGAGFWLFYRHRTPTADAEALSMRVPVKEEKLSPQVKVAATGDAPEVEEQEPKNEE